MPERNRLLKQQTAEPYLTHYYIRSAAHGAKLGKHPTKFWRWCSLMNHFVYFTTPLHVLDLYFGPFEDEDRFHYFDDAFHLEHLTVQLGVFPSLSQSRKNKWMGEIPRGLKEWKIGKKIFWTYRPLLVPSIQLRMCPIPVDYIKEFGYE